LDIGARIKELRTAAGYSQNELAKRAGIAQSSLSYLESGAKSPSIETLLQICEALGVSLSEFMSADTVDIPPDLRQLLREAESLTPEQRKKLVEFIKAMKGRG